MYLSQIQSEATRDAIARRLTTGFILRDVEFTLNESMAGAVDDSTGTMRESNTRNSLLRAGHVTLTGELKWTCQKTISRGWFQYGQSNLQTRTMKPTLAHSDHVEARQWSEIKPAIRRTSAREQQPLLNTAFA